MKFNFRWLWWLLVPAIPLGHVASKISLLEQRQNSATLEHGNMPIIPLCEVKADPNSKELYVFNASSEPQNIFSRADYASPALALLFPGTHKVYLRQAHDCWAEITVNIEGHTVTGFVRGDKVVLGLKGMK